MFCHSIASRTTAVLSSTASARKSPLHLQQSSAEGSPPVLISPTDLKVAPNYRVYRPARPEANLKPCPISKFNFGSVTKRCPPTSPQRPKAISRELHNDNKLRKLALHHLTGLSSSENSRHNRTAHYFAVTRRHAPDITQQEESNQRLLEHDRPEWLNLEPLSVRRERVRLQESIQREFLTKFEPPRSPSTPNHLEPSDLLDQYSDSRYDPAVYLTF